MCRNVTRRYVNALLTSINLPAVGQNTLKARGREVGAAIETCCKEFMFRRVTVGERLSEDRGHGASCKNRGIVRHEYAEEGKGPQ